eukprot:3588589-Rhodomonas_salina.8
MSRLVPSDLSVASLHSARSPSDETWEQQPHGQNGQTKCSALKSAADRIPDNRHGVLARVSGPNFNHWKIPTSYRASADREGR